jgi:hypothetical protein
MAMKKRKESRHEVSGGVTLEQLLRVKKAERPDAAFWADFDRDLQQKLFKTVVDRRHAPLRNFFRIVLHSRSTYAMPVLAAIMVALGIALNRGTSDGPLPQAVTAPVDMIVSVEANTRASAPGAERFVVDRLNVASDAGNFRKVMALGSINPPEPSSTHYVADQLGTAVSRGGVLSMGNSF